MKIHIGSEIQKVMNITGTRMSVFCKKMEMSKQNAYNVLKRETIDTGLLERASKALDYNFFRLYVKSEIDDLRDGIRESNNRTEHYKSLVVMQQDLYERMKKEIIDLTSKKHISGNKS